MIFVRLHKFQLFLAVDQIYSVKLKAEGVASDADTKGWEKEYMDTLNQHFELAKKVTKLSIMDWIDTPWTGFFESKDPNKVFFFFMSNHSVAVKRVSEKERKRERVYETCSVKNLVYYPSKPQFSPLLARSSSVANSTHSAM